MPADEFNNNIIYALPISIAPYGLGNGNLAIPAKTDCNDVFAFTGNLAVHNQGSGVGAVRSTTAKTSGRAYFEVQLGMIMSSDNTMVGIGNARTKLTALTGASGNSVAWARKNGKIYRHGSHANTNPVTGSDADVVAFAFDFNNRKFWVNNLTTGSGWNGDGIVGQNPTTGAGGYPFGSIARGPYFIMISVGSAGDYAILNPGRTPFVGAVPSGYAAWGSTTTLNAADTGGPATLTAPIAYVCGVGCPLRPGGHW